MDLKALEQNYRPMQLGQPRANPVARPDAAADNGLLSLIPFFDIGDKLLSGQGVDAGEVGLEAALTFLPFGKIAKGVGMAGKALTRGGKAAKAASKTTPIRLPVSEQQNLTDFVDYQMRRYNPKTQDLNQMLPKAWATGDKIGIDVRNGAPARVQDQVADYLESYNAKPKTSFSQPSTLGMPAQPPARGTAPGILNMGNKLRGFGRDIRAGSKVPGTTSPLDANQALTINSAIDAANKGIRPKTARGQLMGVQSGLETKGKELGRLTGQFNRPLGTPDGDAIGKLVDEGRQKIVGFRPDNPAHAKLNNSFAERVAKAKDLAELEAERKNFDAEAKRLLKNPDNKGTLSANLAKAYRDAIDKYVSQLAPELKAAKGGYRGLRQGEDLLSRTSTLNPAIKAPIFGGPVPLLGSAKQVASEGLGKALQGIGGSSLPARIGRNAAGQVGRRAVVNPIVAATSQQPPTLDAALADPQGGFGEAAMFDPLSGMAGPAEADMASQNPYPLENLMADIQRDPANQEEYLKTYQMYQELFKQQQPPELTAGQQSMAIRAQNALGDIDVIAQAIESGDIDKGLVPFSDNALVGNALGIGGVNAALYNLGDVILRARTGSAAPAEEVNKFIAGYLPRAGESAETKQFKLQRAYQELLGMVNPPAALGTGTANTLEDALAAY